MAKEEIIREIMGLMERYKGIALAAGGKKFLPENLKDQERLEYHSALFWIGQQGAKNYRGTPANKRFKPYNSIENASHNFNLLKQGGVPMDELTSAEKFAELKEEFLKNIFLKNPFGRAGVVPLNLFYASEDLDEKKLLLLLEAESYKPNNGFSGFKSPWVKDHGGKINYCVYLQEENGYPLFDLKYIAKNRGEKEKYDLVTRFNKEGIREIKHLEFLTNDFSVDPDAARIDFIKKMFPGNVPFLTYFFKDRKEDSCIECYEEGCGFGTRENNLPRNEKSKVILEHILKNEPILAGGAFRRILNFCKENYGVFRKIYRDLKEQS
jgi:hypothetical protein